jgi:transcriptional regulator with XRE-family HTH domain
MFYTIYADLCYRIGKSPSAVAEELGLNKSAVTYWRNNEDAIPKYDTLRKIAEYFNVSIDYLKGKEPLTERVYNDENIYQMRFAAYQELETADEDLVEDVLSYIRFKKSQKKDEDQ